MLKDSPSQLLTQEELVQCLSSCPHQPLKAEIMAVPILQSQKGQTQGGSVICLRSHITQGDLDPLGT